MSQQPRPESRISSLEHRASTIEAQIIEMSSDTAEELKAIRQDIKQLNDGMMSSFKKIGDTFIDTTATKDDISKLETRLDRIETTIATKHDITSIREDMAAMETRIIDTFTRLLQEKPGEE